MIIIMGFRGKTISASKSTPYLTKKCVKLAWRFCLKGALDEGKYVWTGHVILSWEYNCTTTLTQYTMRFFLGSKLSELIPSIFYLASHWKKKHNFALFITSVFITIIMKLCPYHLLLLTDSSSNSIMAVISTNSFQLCYVL